MLNALERVKRDDQRVVLSRDPAVIDQAERVVLPGVGAFGECRKRLDDSGVLPSLTAAVADGRPFLGVCVGMQILADEGYEFGKTAGLGWISGVTRQLTIPQTETIKNPQTATKCRGTLKLPHIGWSTIGLRSSVMLESIRATDQFYFVHSYILDCANPQQVVATAHYGETFCAAVEHKNTFGCQFHPEKSARSGLHILGNFCRWTP